jgi:hypothetical protein
MSVFGVAWAQASAASGDLPVSKPKIVPGAALVFVSCPPTPCLDQLADLAAREAELADGAATTESALVTRLSRIPGPRRRRGLRHPLIVVLALSACATLVVGGNSLTAIWQWAARSSQEKLARLGHEPQAPMNEKTAAPVKAPAGTRPPTV